MLSRKNAMKKFISLKMIDEGADYKMKESLK